MASRRVGFRAKKRQKEGSRGSRDVCGGSREFHWAEKRLKTRKNQKNAPELLASLLRKDIHDFVQEVPVGQMVQGTPFRCWPWPTHNLNLPNLQHTTLIGMKHIHKLRSSQFGKTREREREICACTPACFSFCLEPPCTDLELTALQTWSGQQDEMPRTTLALPCAIEASVSGSVLR